MRMRSLAAGLAAAAVLGAGAGGAGAATSSLAGTYSSIINGARWTLTIRPNGTFSAAARGTGVTGRIVLVRHRVTFSGRKGCPVSAARYRSASAGPCGLRERPVARRASGRREPPGGTL